MSVTGWRKKPIADLFASSLPGDWGDDGNPETGVPVLRSTNFVDGSIDYADTAFRSVAKARLQKRQIGIGTILIEKAGGSSTRPAGRVVYCDRAFNGTASNFVEVIHVRKHFAPKFVFYLLYFNFHHGLVYKYQQQTTGIINFKLREYSAEEVALPDSIHEQATIADILTTVDRAIEQTETLIAKQQRIKTGLMQDLLTRGVDEHGKLRSEQTHKFKDSMLGRIPAEWQLLPLCQLARVERGKFTHRPRDDARFYGGEFPFIQTGDVTSRVGRTVDAFTQTLSHKGTTVSKQFPQGTIAITIAANIADTAILGQPMYFPDSVVGAVVYPPHNTRYIEMAIRSWKPVLERMAPQSAQRNINLEVLRPLTIMTPPAIEQGRIAQIYERAETAQEQLEESRKKLTSLKTAMMQSLLTGKRRVTPLLSDPLEPVA
jgi:type I restriction enzyme S subunit